MNNSSWLSPKEIFVKQKKHKLSTEIIATDICVEAEKLYPDLFHAVSVRNNILHIEIQPEKVLDFKMIEGKLLKGVNEYCTLKEYSQIERIRLTILRD